MRNEQDAVQHPLVIPRGQLPLTEGFTTGNNGCNALYRSLLTFYCRFGATKLQPRTHKVSQSWVAPVVAAGLHPVPLNVIGELK